MKRNYPTFSEHWTKQTQIIWKTDYECARTIDMFDDINAYRILKNSIEALYYIMINDIYCDNTLDDDEDESY